MEKEKIKDLLRRYSEGNCSDTEKTWVEAFYDRLTKKSTVDLPHDIIQKDLRKIYSKLPHRHHISRVSIWRKIAVAAVLLISVSIGFYFLQTTEGSNPQTPISEQLNTNETDFAPGTNKAILTLSDGSTIALDQAFDGKIAEQQGINISKDKDGLIVYTIAQNTRKAQLNTVNTPNGGQYQIILADGTKVWLNAASSITYPTTFTGKERKVELKGEGYFEVAENKKQPFKVITNHQELEVLGTHFNINSYHNEPDIKTTLLEGRVKVSDLQSNQSTLLKPGEQSILREGEKLKVTQVNIESAVAWKSGLFQFHDSDIQQAMRQLARWYNIDIEFEGAIPDIKLWGEIHRDANAIEAMEILAYFDLKYKITKAGTRRKIIIIQ